MLPIRVVESIINDTEASVSLRPLSFRFCELETVGSSSVTAAFGSATPSKPSIVGPVASFHGSGKPILRHSASVLSHLLFLHIRGCTFCNELCSCGLAAGSLSMCTCDCSLSV